MRQYVVGSCLFDGGRKSKAFFGRIVLVIVSRHHAWTSKEVLVCSCLSLLLCGALFYRSRVNALIGPVLKHGPRSLTCMRVVGWKTWRRNESKGRLGLLRWDPFVFFTEDWRCTINRSWSSVNDLSESISVGTRKMVNYACIGRSQRKLWWRLVAILTCKSFVRLGYRGERLIEPSSSWFPPKFPSG